MAIIDALAHAARELVRVLVDPLLGRRDADQAQHLDRRGARASRRPDPLVEQDRLDDLVADGEDRVERGHRLLEDHRDLVAADLPHLGGRAASAGSRP